MFVIPRGCNSESSMRKLIRFSEPSDYRRPSNASNQLCFSLELRPDIAAAFVGVSKCCCPIAPPFSILEVGGLEIELSMAGLQESPATLALSGGFVESAILGNMC